MLYIIFYFTLSFYYTFRFIIKRAAYLCSQSCILHLLRYAILIFFVLLRLLYFRVAFLFFISRIWSLRLISKRSWKIHSFILSVPFRPSVLAL